MDVCFQEILLALLLKAQNGVDIIELNTMLNFIKSKDIKLSYRPLEIINLGNYAVFNGTTYHLRKEFAYELKRKNITNLISDQVNELVNDYINEFNFDEPKKRIKKF